MVRRRSSEIVQLLCKSFSAPSCMGKRLLPKTPAKVCKNPSFGQILSKVRLAHPCLYFTLVHLCRKVRIGEGFTAGRRSGEKVYGPISASPGPRTATRGFPKNGRRGKGGERLAFFASPFLVKMKHLFSCRSSAKVWDFVELSTRRRFDRRLRTMQHTLRKEQKKSPLFSEGGGLSNTCRDRSSTGEKKIHYFFSSGPVGLRDDMSVVCAHMRSSRFPLLPDMCGDENPAEAACGGGGIGGMQTRG